MSVDVHFQNDNGSLTVLVEDRDRAQVFPVSYTCSNVLVEAVNTSRFNRSDRFNRLLGRYNYPKNLLCAGWNVSTIYGMGPCQKWTRLTRDLFIDLLKGHVLSGRWVLVVSNRVLVGQKF